MRIFAPTPGAFQRSLDFLSGGRRVVSLVGGGGKSTLMYFLAQTCAKQGRRVLVTTTTNIFRPHPRRLCGGGHRPLGAGEHCRDRHAHPRQG